MMTPKEIAKVQTLTSKRDGYMRGARLYCGEQPSYYKPGVYRREKRAHVAKARKANRELIAIKVTGRNRPVTVIAQALLQLMNAVSDNAATACRDDLTKLDARFSESGRVIDVIAPELPAPDYNMGRDAYRKAAAKVAARNGFRAFLRRMTNTERDATNAASGAFIVEEVEREVSQAVEAARYSFLVYIAKMEGKIPNPKAATIHESWRGGLWTHSHLVVELQDGTQQIWRTQQIWNTSVHGLRFQQWPSRVVKSVNEG